MSDRKKKTKLLYLVRSENRERDNDCNADVKAIVSSVRQQLAEKDTHYNKELDQLLRLAEEALSETDPET
nr:hypothetical protein [Hyphomonas sp. Mor2]